MLCNVQEGEEVSVIVRIQAQGMGGVSLVGLVIYIY